MHVNQFEGQGSSQSPISAAETQQTVYVCVRVCKRETCLHLSFKHTADKYTQYPFGQLVITERHTQTTGLGHLCQSELVFALHFDSTFYFPLLCGFLLQSLLPNTSLKLQGKNIPQNTLKMIHIATYCTTALYGEKTN